MEALIIKLLINEFDKFVMMQTKVFVQGEKKTFNFFFALRINVYD